MIKDKIYIYTFYRFKNLEDIKSIRIKLYKYLKNKLILGTILLANEGINGTISGTKKDLSDFIYLIKQTLKIRKLSIKIEALIFNFLENKSLKSYKQTGESTMYPRRNHTDSCLDSKKSISEQFNLLRVCDNDKYPAFFFHKNKKYIIKIYEE